MPTEDDARGIVLVWMLAMFVGLIGLAVNWWVQRGDDE